MKNYKEFILNSLKNSEGFKFVKNPAFQVDENHLLTEFKGGTFIISFNDNYDASRLNSTKSLVSPFTVNLPVILTEPFKSMPLFDKLIVSNHLNNKSSNLVRFSVRESLNMFIISAPYYPMLEQLSKDFFEEPVFNKKSGSFMVLSLLTMCWESSTTLTDDLNNYLKNPKKYYAEHQE